MPVRLVNSARSRSCAARAAATESGVGAYTGSSELDTWLAWGLSMAGGSLLLDRCQDLQNVGQLRRVRNGLFLNLNRGVQFPVV